VLYFNEEKLRILLLCLFHEGTWIHNKSVPMSGIQSRPDYRNEHYKLIVEFDGYQHFTIPKRILSDIKKETVYSDMGYTFIQIPYFVQITTQTVLMYFNRVIDKSKLSEIGMPDFPHGFIAKEAATPAYFCKMGIARYEKILLSLPKNIVDDILASYNFREIEYNEELLEIKY
jgi:hypothetical protein